MPSDYEQICRDNLEEYGKGTRHLSFLERLYSERTHFIFELLQNAEDAHATRVQFDLQPDRLRYDMTDASSMRSPLCEASAASLRERRKTI